MINKENFKTFIIEGSAQIVWGVLKSVEHLKDDISTADNPYYFKCAEKRTEMKESFKKFSKAICFASTKWRAESGKSFVDTFINFDDEETVKTFVREVIIATDAALYDVEYEKYSM